MKFLRFLPAKFRQALSSAEDLSTTLTGNVRETTLAGAYFGISQHADISPAFPDRLPNHFRRSYGIFVFPDSDDLPASFSEAAICVGVARLVSLDLSNPEVGVLLRGSMMLRAAMPEASVKEDRDLGPSENDVCGTTDLRHWAQPYAVAHAQSMQGRAERKLWPCVTALIATHHIADGEGGCPGVRVLGARHGSLVCRGSRPIGN